MRSGRLTNLARPELSGRTEELRLVMPYLFVGVLSLSIVHTKLLDCRPIAWT